MIQDSDIGIDSAIGSAIGSELVPLKRIVSSYTSNQGDKPLCWAHSATRVLARTIKVVFKNHFPEEIETLENNVFDFLYNTVLCNENQTIFSCIKNFNSYTLGIEQTQLEATFLSVLLFHFILIKLKETYGCQYGSVFISFFFILDYFKYTHITSDLIKTVLNYDNTHDSMFDNLISKLVSAFEDIQIALDMQTFQPNIFVSFELENFLLVVSDDLSSPPKITDTFNPIPPDKNNLYNPLDITHKASILDIIKKVLEKGFYVVLDIYKHSITITNIEEDTLIVKNSYGPNNVNWNVPNILPPIQFVVNNRVEWKRLEEYIEEKKHKKYTGFITLTFILPIDVSILHMRRGPITLKRAHSFYTSNQGREDLCWAHAMSRLLAKFIKVSFPSYFIFGNERMNEYYHTVNCSTKNTIFNCIITAQQKWNSLMIKKQIDPIDWNTENLSALLFHFIYTTLIVEYEKDGKKDGPPELAIFFILRIVLMTDITSDMIKKVLRYSLSQFNKSQVDMFETLINKLETIFKAVKIALENKTIKPNIFISLNLGDFKLLERVDDSNKIITINPKKNKLDRVLNIKSSRFFYRKARWFTIIIELLKKNLYVLLYIYDHALIISDFDGQKFIVKDSFGPYNKSWTEFTYNIIEDNKIDPFTLYNYIQNPPVEPDSTNQALIGLIFILPELPELPEKVLSDSLTKKSLLSRLFKHSKRYKRTVKIGGKLKTKKTKLRRRQLSKT
jgi:hypothetical protein